MRTRSAGGAVRLSELIGAADDRGFALVLLVATLPFVLPFPTLGLATPVGFALAAAALGLVAGRRAALPAALGAIEIRPAAMDRVHAVASRAGRLFARLTRPRLAFMLGGRAGAMRIALGVSLFVAAVVLGLPIPLPLSNFFPASAILLLAAGVLEEDGLLVLFGHVATLTVCAVVALSSTAALAVAGRLLHTIR